MAAQQLCQHDDGLVGLAGSDWGKVIASGSAFINPQVDNIVTISLDLKKKKLCEFPNSDFKLKIKSPGKCYEKNMNDFVQDMPKNKTVKFRDAVFWARIHINVGNELTFELVDQVSSPGDYLTCLESSVEVIPK